MPMTVRDLSIRYSLFAIRYSLFAVRCSLHLNPFHGHKLWSLPNVIITPYAGGFYGDYRARVARDRAQHALVFGRGLWRDGRSGRVGWVEPRV
jgi:hypothetical protein